MLVALIKRLKIAKDTGAYSKYGEGDIIYYFNDEDLKRWFDFTREEISLCNEIGVHSLRFPRKRYKW